MEKPLLYKLIKATGMPYDQVIEELEPLLKSLGKTPEEISLDDIREVLASYMQDTLVWAKKRYPADVDKT